MQAKQGSDGLQWLDLRDLGVEGRGWEETESFYDRLPARAKGVVRDPVWQLSRNSAGLAGRFVTDAPAISARWRLRNAGLSMYHMPSTAVSGIDLYVHHQEAWRWMGISREITYPETATVLADGLDTQSKRCMVYLPLYNGVERVEIGVPAGASLLPDQPRTPEKSRPICVYGTSIVNGACASRPGMAYPAILGRRLDRPTINLGFSGNGRMEKEMAELLAELDPAVYVIDCLPNMDNEAIEARVEALVNTLRGAHPDTPLVFVENIPYARTFNAEWQRRYQRKNEAQNRVLDRLAAIRGIHRIACDNLIGRDGEGTVDGTHPTDVGFMRMAEALHPILRQLLNGP
jgi:lysophospholipase L1-like esterase